MKCERVNAANRSEVEESRADTGAQLRGKRAKILARLCVGSCRVFCFQRPNIE